MKKLTTSGGIGSTSPEGPPAKVPEFRTVFPHDRSVIRDVSRTLPKSRISPERPFC